MSTRIIITHPEHHFKIITIIINNNSTTETMKIKNERLLFIEKEMKKGATGRQAVYLWDTKDSVKNRRDPKKKKIQPPPPKIINNITTPF